MAKVISFINLKGGVGKTTTTVAVAEMLSSEFHRKVLVIDLDPQTNATLMLIGDDKWKELDENNHTLAQLFTDALDPNNRGFDLSQTLQRQVSNIAAVKTIDLLPSSLKIIDEQDKLATIPLGQFYANSPIDILRRGIRPIVDNYDYVLIDCPPNLGIITLNGLRISQGYIIPTIPDTLSTYRIPDIIKKVNEFSEIIAEPIEPFGIVISKYQENMPLHRKTLDDLHSRKDAPVFETTIPQRKQIAEAAEFIKPNYFSKYREKWGLAGQVDYLSLTKEIIKRVHR